MAKGEFLVLIKLKAFEHRTRPRLQPTVYPHLLIGIMTLEGSFLRAFREAISFPQPASNQQGDRFVPRGNEPERNLST